jgi:hypothetical protein
MPRFDTTPPWYVKLVYVALAVAFCSHIFSWTNLRASGLMDGDPGLNVWVLNWIPHALVTAPSQILNGNAFYPASGSVALAEHMFSLALVNALIRPFTDSPWFGNNLLIFLAYVLSATGGYRLTAYVTRSRTVGFFGGIFWGFLFYRIHHLGHLQILSFQWLPYSLYALLRFAEEGGAANAARLAVFVTLQSLTSWYLAVIDVVALAVTLPFVLRREHGTQRFLVPFAAAVAAVLLAVGPFVPAYVHQAQASTMASRHAIVRDTGDMVQVADFLTPPLDTWLGRRIDQNRYWIWQENTLYIGYVPLALAGLAVCVLLFGRRRPETGHGFDARLAWAGMALIATGYLFALGYRSRAWDTYLPLDYVARAVPFLYGLRATQRFVLVVDLGVLLLAGQGLWWLLRRVGNRTARGVVAAACASLFLFEVYPGVLPVPLHREFAWDAADVGIHSIQRTVSRPLVVLHLPIFYFRQGNPVDESRYMVGSTLHWAKIVNGFSGETPPGFMDRMRVLNTFPSEAAWAELRSLGVDVIALHRELDGRDQDAMAAFAADRGAAPPVRLPGDERLLRLCFGASARELGCP